MAKWVFLNGSFLEEEKALLSFQDISFQRGYGVFDFFRLVGNEPLFLEDHLDRFFFSAGGMHLPVPLARNDIKLAVLDLINRNNLPDTGIRLSLTGGNAGDGFNIGNPAFLISQHRFAPPAAELVEKGISLMTYHYQRQLPRFKTIDYLMAVWLQPERIKAGADDILYHYNGLISESPRSNFFLVTADGTIATPSDNALAGITRKKVIEIAASHYTVEVRDVRLEELVTAREAFITSTTKGILPVSRINGIVYNQRHTSCTLRQLFSFVCQ